VDDAGSGAVAVDTHRFPCPACGADLRYQPGADRLACQHCGHQEAVPDRRGGLVELDLRAAAEGVPADALEETRTVRCESCGAVFEFDAAVHARECPFCASPVVADTGVNRHIKPQAQLPFLISEDEARTAMRTWLGRLWFAPNDLKAYARADRALQGMYVPYWTYDAETETDYTGQRGIVHYVSRRVRMNVKGRSRLVTQQVPKVRWSPARGRVARRFDDVLVLGSRSLPKRFTDALEPWDLSALSAYEPRYLAGFRAEGYTVPVEEAYQEARAIMNGVIEADVRRDIGGDQQRITGMETRVGRLTFKHVLLPVWMAAYRYRGRSFRFVINGRTGDVQGERPYSAVKIAIAVFLALLLALAIAALQIAQG
jgi:DNA-directed RNA polymerase subunit RPC12/RpoP